jgi:hypothetical protein
VTIVWLPGRCAGCGRPQGRRGRRPRARSEALAPPDRRPARPVEPDRQPGWRMASLGFLAAALARAGWRCRPPRGPAAAPGSGRRPEHGRVTPLDGVACASGRAVRFVPPACTTTRQPRPPNVSMLPGPAHPGRPRWQRPGQPSRADSAARQPRTSGPGAGVEPALGDGNDDQGDADQQPVAAEWSLPGPPLTARWAWGLPCRCRCAPSRSRGIRGTTGRLRRAGAASGGVGLCIARAWPSWPPWA